MFVWVAPWDKDVFSLDYLLDRWRGNLIGGVILLFPIISCLCFIFAPGSLVAVAIGVVLLGLTLGAELDLIAAESLNEGETTSLHANLDAADRMVTSGETTAAVNQLEAFVLSLEAIVRSGRLTEAEATTLLVGAARLIDDLGG